MGSNFEHYKNSEEFQKARMVEEFLLRFYRNYGYNVRSATDEEQVEDIDLWVGGKSFSVKNQQAVLKTGRVCFEEYDKGKESWFRTGKADYYAICWGKWINIYDAKELKERVNLLDSQNKVIRRGLTNKQSHTNLFNRHTRLILVKKEDVFPLIKERIRYNIKTWCNNLT